MHMELHQFAIFVLLFPVAWTLSTDPYGTLGLRRGVPLQDVKKAFKKLAREWHPDKNRSPKAEEKFIEISEAYEYLSDPKKKEHFDAYGTVETQESRFDRGGGPQFFHHGFFEEFGFRMPEPSKLFQKFVVSKRKYEEEILPKSFNVPYLLLVYSDYCYACKRAEPLWEKLVSDVEPLGVGVGTVNNAFQKTLVHQLRVKRLPTIVAVVDGRVHHYKDALHPSAIVKWLKRSLPLHLVKDIDDRNIDWMLSRWTTNRVPVLIFGSMNTVRLRYMVLAMKYRDFCTFGYALLSRQLNAHSMKRFGVVNAVSETLLIFNEYEEVVTMVSHRRELSVESISSTLESHKFLILPRLSSQEHLDAVCPPDRRRLCAVLLARKSLIPGSYAMSDDEIHINALRHYAQDALRDNPARSPVHYAYMWSNMQVDFVSALLPNHVAENNSYLPLVILRRLDSAQFSFDWLPSGWSGEPGLVNHCSDALRMHLNRYLTSGDLHNRATILQQLYNENGPSLYWKVAHKTMRLYESVMFHFEREELYPILTLALTVLVIAGFSYCFNFVLALEGKTPKPQARKLVRRNVEHTEDFAKLCHELRAETYYGLVRSLKPGCRSVILLVDGDSKDILLNQFKHAVWPWRKNMSLMFGYLRLDKNFPWYQELLMSVIIDPMKVSQINPRNCIGTVLVINGFRQYFQLYHVRHLQEQHDKFSTKPRKVKKCHRRRQDAAESLGFEESGREESESSSSEDSEEAPLPAANLGPPGSKVFVHELLLGLPSWLDRLFDGQISEKYFISEWPDIR